MNAGHSVAVSTLLLIILCGAAAATCVDEDTRLITVDRNRVLNSKKVPLPHALIRAYDESSHRAVFTTRSDEKGEYSLMQLRSGTYRVRITDSKYQHIVFWYRLKLSRDRSGTSYEVPLRRNSECHDMTINDKDEPTDNWQLATDN